ncbi:MAG TPA: HAD family hydrolase [Myxococcota bacterium]|nr:HAD family hydrolase [Myxococcota bacterium]
MAGRGVRAVLLDMGGVLLPEQQTYERAVRDAAFLAALRDAGVVAPEAFVADRAKRLREAYRALEPERTQPDLEAVFADDPPAVRRLLLGAFKRESSPPPYAHAREVVAALARDYALGLVSNTAMPGHHHADVLRRAGILQHFGAAVWSANFGRRKPDPAIVRFVLDELRVPREHAVLAGDKLRTDVAAARNAGVRSVYIRKRGAPWAGRELRPDFTIGDLRGLPFLLRGLG